MCVNFEDTLEAKDRNARGQGQGPRTQAQVFIKRKKKSPKFFSGVLQQKTPSNIFFQAIYKISTIQKQMLSSSRGQAVFEDLRPRGQGQGLQNVTSRIPPLVSIIVTQNLQI